jgi:uncharacterized protein YdhG (YjbR/CyaY superfamily)
MPDVGPIVMRIYTNILLPFKTQMEKNIEEISTLEDCIQYFPEKVQVKLQELKHVIKEQVPEAEEEISYRMAAFFPKGILVWMGGFKRHIRLYPKASGIAPFVGVLAPQNHSKGTTQFPLDEPLPVELIQRIVKF